MTLLLWVAFFFVVNEAATLFIGSFDQRFANFYETKPRVWKLSETGCCLLMSILNWIKFSNIYFVGI